MLLTCGVTITSGCSKPVLLYDRSCHLPAAVRGTLPAGCEEQPSLGVNRTLAAGKCQSRQSWPLPSLWPAAQVELDLGPIWDNSQNSNVSSSICGVVIQGRRQSEEDSIHGVLRQPTFTHTDCPTHTEEHRRQSICNLATRPTY